MEIIRKHNTKDYYGDCRSNRFIEHIVGSDMLMKFTDKSEVIFEEGENAYLEDEKIDNNNKIDIRLFNLLKAVRMNISIKEKLPPFMIFHDSTLKEISSWIPINTAELKQVRGIGDKKIEQYGAEILTVIQKYVEENHLTLQENRHTTNCNVKIKTKTKDEREKSHIITFQMYKSGKNIKEIIKHRGLARITIEEHLFKCFNEGMDVNLDEFIPAGSEKLILDTVKNYKGERKLRLIKELLPPEVQYSAIKAVLYKYKEVI